jgi:hypothetical protein
MTDSEPATKLQRFSILYFAVFVYIHGCTISVHGLKSETESYDVVPKVSTSGGPGLYRSPPWGLGLPKTVTLRSQHFSAAEQDMVFLSNRNETFLLMTLPIQSWIQPPQPKSKLSLRLILTQYQNTTVSWP